MFTKYAILTTLLTLTTAQYFYPAIYTPRSSVEEVDDTSSSPDSGEYIELIRVPRALPHHLQQQRPSYNPSSPLPPRVGAPGGIPLPPSPMAHRHSGPYEPMMASSSKKEPLVTAESHGHGHHHGHDYVDYGAYTGGWGAFGWYTDHPVHSYGH